MIRKVIIAILALGAVAIALAYFLTIGSFVAYVGESVGAGIDRGLLFVASNHTPDPWDTGVLILHEPRGSLWLTAVDSVGPGWGGSVGIPLWMIFVAFASYPITEFVRGPMRRWRRRQGQLSFQHDGSVSILRGARPRIRMLSVAGLLTSAIITIAFVVSFRASFGCSIGKSATIGRLGTLAAIGCSEGDLMFVFFTGPGPDHQGWDLWWGMPGHTHGWSSLWRGGIAGDGSIGIIAVPLWMPFVLLLLLSWIAWRMSRRPPPGRCCKCGYDLTGNVSGVCPECGTEIEPP